MASQAGGDDSIFERLSQTLDPKVIENRTQAINERAILAHQKAQARLVELIDENSTLPTTISSIQVLGATHTRRGFLERIFNPLLAVNQERPFTLSEALREVSVKANTLSKFGIYHQPISLFFDKPNKTDPSSTPTDIDIYLSVKERGRVELKTGTDLGNTEGSAYGNLLVRNVFGGAESLNLNASLGTRTRSAYQGVFSTPILSNPDFLFELGALQSSTTKSWASHEELLRGGWSKFRYLTSSGSIHEFGYNGYWRQLTGLAVNASPTVRNEAGDSVKSSISHVWVQDRRDNPTLPSSGYLAKTTNEIAGWGPLKGDVAFWKSELESSTALPIPIPGIKGPSGITFTTGFRAGLLYPLALDGKATPESSRINDRFQLGGPTDVRGFRLSGLGPRDGSDALGGDVYAAGSANLLFPLPRVGAERPLRLQAFVNGGRLLALKNVQKDKEGPTTSEDIRNSVIKTINEVGNGLPSMSAGVGLVYAHPVARFELNFSLPLVLRKGEEGRKGLQLGIGINFL
ncbi:putative outer membrane omp85 family [Phaeomoniella chlamydospora]|uniref:Putative outer membrane omp85 family n=1 Tax=Phaeomoniella chlamydospora TaxID=158046 RepID=A0A0G2E5T0_PHACM|nr:putative outer membrane omp85 family [Phaeomoniella chlamydospora]